MHDTTPTMLVKGRNNRILYEEVKRVIEEEKIEEEKKSNKSDLYNSCKQFIRTALVNGDYDF